MFKEFVETFEEAPSSVSKVWVKAGTYDAGSRSKFQANKIQFIILRINKNIPKQRKIIGKRGNCTNHKPNLKIKLSKKRLSPQKCRHFRHQHLPPHQHQRQQLHSRKRLQRRKSKFKRKKRVIWNCSKRNCDSESLI